MTVRPLERDERSLADAALEWCDQWWDDARGLPWGPPGHEAVTGPRSVHLVPQAGWYAVGLFLRDRGEDRQRALRIVDELCDLQYDESGTDWHGTFPIMAETPHPPAKATMWLHYDPNWRQFIGLSWLLLLEHWGDVIPDTTVARLEASLRLAVEGEPLDRCPASYTNIALMRAVFETTVGERLAEPGWVTRGERIAAQVDGLHARSGAFEEFNSPTYSGVDLYALALGRQLPSSPAVREVAGRLEEALWRSIGHFFHPGLGNLCGPWTRSYGRDMHRYLAKLSLPLWLAVGEGAPHPGFAPEVTHGHDWFAGAPTALVGTTVPGDVREELRRFVGPLQIEQPISSSRRATAWLHEGVMAGAESCEADLSWWEQYFAAVLHWRADDGSIGWLTVRAPGPSHASAPDGELHVPASGPSAVAQITVAPDVAPPRGRRWDLGGLQVDLSVALDRGSDDQTWLAPPGSDLVLVVSGAPG